MKNKTIAKLSLAGLVGICVFGIERTYQNQPRFVDSAILQMGENQRYFANRDRQFHSDTIYSLNLGFVKSELLRVRTIHDPVTRESFSGIVVGDSETVRGFIDSYVVTPTETSFRYESSSQLKEQSDYTVSSK